MLNLQSPNLTRVHCTFWSKADDTDLPNPHVKLHQVHGNDVVVVREPSHADIEADGMITDVPGLHLVIGAADCQNIAFYAPEQHVVGALHAGWRGVMQGIIPNMIKTLTEQFDVEPSTLQVMAGPSLRQGCAEFKDSEHELRQWVDKQYLENDHIDLPAIADDQLLATGVQAENIYRHPDCTCNHPDRYWTYRGGDRADVKSGLHNFLVCQLLT